MNASVPKQPVFRFAPSPNGELHLGHAYSALLNQFLAKKMGGRLLLRIEDIDLTRCTPEYENMMLEDLAWLGVEWEGEPRRQSEHLDDYRLALENLTRLDLVYPSTLTRGQIRKLTKGKDWPVDPDGSPHYPGSERLLEPSDKLAVMESGKPYALRLDTAKAMETCTDTLFWTEFSHLPEHRVAANPAAWGDVVVARKDAPCSYHLCCVLDDALQGVTHIVRGMDLFHATSIHRLLQHALKLDCPLYHHHQLVRDAGGKKLSKSDGSTSIRSLRGKGLSRDDVRALLPPLG